MKILGVAVLLCTALLLLNTECRAQTAEEMLSACRPITQAKVSNGMIDMPTDFDSGTCWGAFGMLQSVLFLQEPDGELALHACVPPDATRTELIAIFVKNVEDHPEEYGKGFQLVAINSMIKAYPCGKKK